MKFRIFTYDNGKEQMESKGFCGDWKCLIPSTDPGTYENKFMWELYDKYSKMNWWKQFTYFILGWH